jgi:type VII secretion integral membrane protein EccD
VRTPAPPAYCRLTVLAPARRVDVALPVDVPLAELVPMVLELLGGPARPVGPPESWRFTGVTGGPLSPGSTLDELGVLDGEMLRFGPAVPPPPPPVFDDPVDALADLAAPATSGPPPWPGLAAFATALAAAGLLTTVRGSDSGTATLTWAVVVLGGLGCAVALAGAARAARSRGPDGGRTGSIAALVPACCAVPLAAAAGWAALPGPPDAAHLLLAVVAGGTTAALGQVAVRAVAPVLIAAVVVAVLAGTAIAGMLRFGVSAGAPAGVVAAVALSAGPLLPRVALRLAGVPRPVVPGDAAALVADAGPDLLPAAELAERARLARGLLAGLSGGCAVSAGVAAAAATSRGWAGVALAAVVVAVSFLRARGFADPGLVRLHLAVAVAAGIALVGLVAWAAGPAGRLAGALVLLGAAGAGALGRTAPPASPVVRRAVDVGEWVLTAAAVPLALAAAGVFELVRGLWPR